MTAERIVAGDDHDPHATLGAHKVARSTVVRVYRPAASRVDVVVDGVAAKMKAVEPQGFFEFKRAGDISDYRLRITYPDGVVDEVDDPYRFLPSLGELDLHLISEGTHERLWTVLGANPKVHQDVAGTAFAVWAPNARGVRIVGDLNVWDGRAHPMRSLGHSGVWELFLPGIGAGATYKFEVLGADGVWSHKADPLAKLAQVPPDTASVVTASDYSWADGDWMAHRADRPAHQAPMSVYEVHLGSWRRGLGYRELADQLTAYVADLGFTHVELLPIAEHPFGGSWGYQVSSYFAPTSRFGSPDDFRYLVDRLHAAGIGVIVDWVPAHFPRDDWALALFDGTPLYEHPDPQRGAHPDWGTLVFNFGRREVANFLLANALYWLEEFHLDGLRVDAVASMLYLDYSREDGSWSPNAFGGKENLEAVDLIRRTNSTVYATVPGAVTIAEESTSWPAVSRPVHLGGLGFGFKWNMGWMHDTLGYLTRPPIYRRWHHHQMTFSMMYAHSENFVLPLSHDEVVHGKGSLLGKMPGSPWQQHANLRALFAYMWAHPGKQLLFMGGELAQPSEWAESGEIEWHLLGDPAHRGVQSLVRDLNSAYRAHPALWTQDSEHEGFRWIDADDADDNVLSFLRFAPDGSVLACLANFAGVSHEGFRVGLPEAGTWREVINTDAEVYGGSGVGNLGAVVAGPQPWHGLPASAVVVLPPLATVWLVPERSVEG